MGGWPGWGGVGWVKWVAGARVAEGLRPARFRPAPRLGSTQLLTPGRRDGRKVRDAPGFRTRRWSLGSGATRARRRPRHVRRVEFSMEEEERRDRTSIADASGRGEGGGRGCWGVGDVEPPLLNTEVLVAQGERIEANVVEDDGRGQCFPDDLTVLRGAFSHRGFVCLAKSVVRPVPQTQAARVRPT